MQDVMGALRRIWMVRVDLGVLCIGTFTLWPTTNFYVRNLGLDISLIRVALVALAVFVVCVAVYKLGSRLLPFGQERIAAVVSVGTFMFFAVQLIRSLLAMVGVQAGIMISWFSISVVAIVAIYVVVMNKQRLLLLTIFGGAGVMTALLGLFNVSSSEVAVVRGLGQGSNGSFVNKSGGEPLPNVYYIIVDAYARGDQLEKWADFDNSGFHASLKDRRFITLDKATSNYDSTILSIPSTLSMRYLITDKGREIASFENALRILHGDNATYEMFRQLDYKIVVSGSLLCNEDVDRCITRPFGISRDLRMLFWMTPLPVAVSYISPKLYGHISREGIVPIHEMASEVSKLKASPRFTMIHTMEVHDSSYGADCRFRSDLARTDLKRMNFVDRLLRDKKSYADSVRCTNKALLSLIDQILKEELDPLIVISADHGVLFSERSDGKFKRFERTNPAEGLSVLSSWRLPSSCQGLLYESMSNVNHFRAIKACLTRKKPQYIRDISYWTKVKVFSLNKRKFDPKNLMPIEW